ncbi:hypothetical protein X736_13220 [Mesorhizobium sp. L2C089B000]|nr:hypothetical protein X736_13220 [Mesorhizobium sp. L2C089B000]
MRITFYDADNLFVGEQRAGTNDHWDACLIGHALIASGTFPGAEDFQVHEPVEAFVDCSNALLTANAISRLEEVIAA